MAIYPEKIPADVKSLDQWGCYKLEWIDDRRTKVPYSPKDGSRAKSTDPDTWTSFDSALSSFQNGEGYDGVCFFITRENGLVFIDLDHSIKNGVIEPWALDITKKFDSYTERSQSGEGLHILVRGTKPGDKCRSSKSPYPVEIYDHARQCCLTGDVVEVI